MEKADGSMLYGRTKRVENVGIRAGGVEAKSEEVVLVDGWAAVVPVGPEGKFVAMVAGFAGRLFVVLS